MMLTSTHQPPWSILLVSIGSATTGVAIGIGLKVFIDRKRIKNEDQTKKKKDPETCVEPAKALVWGAIGGALNASQLYIGDRLGLYQAIAKRCEQQHSVNALQLANDTGFNQRWLREWLAQQAAMGVLILQPGTGDDDATLFYRLPKSTATVLANPSSPDYEISMVAAVPSLVNRAKTMLPEAFRSGIGRPYDEPEVASAIDRQHTVHIRDVFIPKVLPKVQSGDLLEQLKAGCQVGDLGCGGGNLIIAMAKAFPKSTFHGFEVSQEALSICAYNTAQAKLSNVFIHDANIDPIGDHVDLDIVTTFDVLHDAPNPGELIQQVRKTGAVWVLGDIPCKDGIRENVTNFSGSSTYFAFSTCLCMACSLSKPGGAGLGTLGFSVPVAERMLEAGGFANVEVILEHPGARWFFVR